MLSSPKQIPIQSLLYKTTTCLTQPATTLPRDEMGNIRIATMHKKNFSLIVFTLLLLYNA